MTAMGRPRIEPEREVMDARAVMVTDDGCCTGIDLGLLLARVVMGAYLVMAGYSKMQMAGDAWMQQYSGLLDKAGLASLPPWLTTTYGQAIPYLEMVIGALLIVGLMGRVAGGIGFIMITSFTIAVVASGMPADTAEEPRSMISRIWEPIANHGPGPFSANFTYIALTLLFMLGGVGRLGFDGLLFRRKGQAT